MTRSLLAFGSVLLLLAPRAAAQQPAPAAETLGTLGEAWSADEAMLWSWLREASAQLRDKGPGAFPLRMRGRPQIAPGFVGTCYTPGDQEWNEGPPKNRNDDWTLYVWPEQAGNTARFAFCLASDGRLLVSANSEGCVGTGTAPRANAATGAGSPGLFKDLLAVAGKGQDGQQWENHATLRNRSLAVVIQDEKGTAWPNTRFALVAPSWLPRERTLKQRAGSQPIVRPLPAGTSTTDAEGKAKLEGPAASGLYACAGNAQSMITLLPAETRLDGERLIVTLPRAVMNTAVLAPNERSAIGNLRNIASAQAQCQASGVIDADQDGTGEYGCFAELSGITFVHGRDGAVTETRINPPVVPVSFGKIVDGLVQRHGYCFRMYLPGKDGKAASEDGKGLGMKDIAVDPDLAEVTWCCYAWPITAGETGQRTFFVDQNGSITACDNASGRYSGVAQAPSADAARVAISEGKMNDPMAVKAKGRDGQLWVVVK